MKLMGVSISGKMTEDLPPHVSQTTMSLISAISDPVVVCKVTGEIAFLNPAARRFLQDIGTGGSDAVEDASILDLFPDNAPNLSKVMSLCRTQSGIFPGSLQIAHTDENDRNQSRLPFQGSMLRLQGHQPSHVLLRFIASSSVSRHQFEELNATLRKKNRQLLFEREKSRKDTLTGLWKRSTLFSELPRYIQRIEDQERPTSFAVIDLDNFKEINDLHGHPCGDKVLACLGELLLQECRSLDKVARIGGEEFALILPNTSFLEADKACQRIRERIKQTHVQYEGHEIQITASFGLTEITIGETAEEVYKRADYALYAAKKAGRDKVAVIEPGSSRSRITQPENIQISKEHP